jgi:hypothetical protein
MGHSKILVALAIGIIIFVLGFIGGSILQTNLSARTPNQNNSLTMENLQVKGYTPRLLTEYALEFNLQNTGTNDIQITDVRLNGYSNQTTDGISQGWNGTTFLAPNQTGILYVYAPCYTQVINQTMPQLQQSPTQTELENFEIWICSYNSTFTFVTDTGHQYNYTIPSLGFGLCSAVTTWAERSQTFEFKATEQLKITSLQFGTAATVMNVTMLNTGTNTITITEVHVNNGANLISTASPAWTGVIKGNANATETFTFAWANGAQYEIELRTAKGNQFIYSATAPS